MKPAKFSQVTWVKTAVLFSQLYIQKNLLWKEFWKRVYGWKISLKMFGSISKDSPNMESFAPLYYIPRRKIARSNKMLINCFLSFP